MSGVQFLIIAVAAAIVTLPIVTLIPRARQSPTFDRVLWGATWLLAFLGAWYAVGNLNTDSPLYTLKLEDFVRVAGGAIILGTVVGALSLNALLWLMDRFTAFEAEQPDADMSAPDMVEDDDERTHPESR